MTRNILLTLLAACCVVGIGTYGILSGHMSVLAPTGLVALSERSVLLVTFLLSGLVVIPVFALLFTFAYKYHADNLKAPEKHAPNWDHDNWRAELLWWFVPAIIILILSLIAWQSSHELDPYRPISSDVPPLTIEVVALDWKWLFIYPSLGIATVNQLELPAGTPIHFVLTADAPMNSFWIPSLSGQIMVMPGMSTQLNILASSTGSFNGSSANISGAGFAGMTFVTNVVSKDDFVMWAKSVTASSTAPTLSLTEYDALRRPSQNVPPILYIQASSRLYDSIIMRYMAPTTIGKKNIVFEGMGISTSAMMQMNDMNK